MSRETGRNRGDSCSDNLAANCCNHKPCTAPVESTQTPAVLSKRLPAEPAVLLSSKRQRFSDHDDSSAGEEWSSSETCMSERVQSHSYASSSCSTSSSPPPSTLQHCSDWHTLPDPVPASFQEVSRLQPTPTLASSSRWDLLCSLEFSADGTQLAAAGVGKQVRIYPVSTGIEQDPIISSSCSRYLHSKLSSLCWSPTHEDVIALGDYDGVVTQLHTVTGHCIWQADDHDGARIWSVNFSPQNPSLLASACEDGTARLWTHHTDSHVALIAPRSQAALCSAVFSPTDSNLLALGSADHNAYVYDLRAPQDPLYVLSGHQRPVSYVKFLASGQDLITASIDGSLAHWQTSSSQADDLSHPFQHQQGPSLAPGPQQPNAACSMHLDPIRRFRGHKNQRNFVGLAVEPSTDLIACGSEDSEVYLFHTAWADPMGHQPLYAKPSLPSSNTQSTPDSPENGRSFASAVAWQPRSSLSDPNNQLLAAALSDSGVQLFRPYCH